MRFKPIQLFVFLFIVFLLISFFPIDVEARSGCCSWHGGVCGCRCCDGTSLSSKCAPYYPSCSDGDTVTKIREKTLGDLCLRSSDCETNLICVDNNCQESPNGEKRLSKLGEICTKKSECEQTLSCGDSTCIQTHYKSSYESCDDDNECVSGLNCIMNRCVKPNIKFKGESCYFDNDCFDRMCVHGTCRESNPYCGDKFCDDGETCFNCEEDCQCKSDEIIINSENVNKIKSHMPVGDVVSKQSPTFYGIFDFIHKLLMLF